jgi:uncharacterized membrane protein
VTGTRRGLAPSGSGAVLASGALLGVGTASFVDQAVFHLVLGWHHFWDGSTPHAALVSDGLFHAFGWFATVGGLFLLADLQRACPVSRSRWWGGVLLGLGGFQLYDGLVQHTLLGLHQIRYGVDLLPYDLAWDGVAVALLVAGVVLVARSRRPAREAGAVGVDVDAAPVVPGSGGRA